MSSATMEGRLKGARDAKWWHLPSGKGERFALAMIGIALAFQAHDAGKKIYGWTDFTVYLLLALLVLFIASVVLRASVEFERDKSKRWLQIPAMLLLILLMVSLQRVAVPVLAG